MGVDDLEVIVIDDASTDASWSLLQRWTSSHPVIAIRNRQRLNYGGSLKVGFRKATGHLIGFMDMDGTYAPEEFCRLINVLDLNTAVVVCGNRLSTISGMPWIRYLGNYFYVGLIRFLYGQRVDDGCTGQRVFARALLDELCEIPIMGLNFSLAMTLHCLIRRHILVESPISYRERIGNSKLIVMFDGPRFFITILSVYLRRQAAAPRTVLNSLVSWRK